MSKTKHATTNMVIQFRTGEWIGGKLSKLAKVWKLTPHEAARRLMVLAMFRLTLDHYPAIERLEKVTGGSQNFLRACDQAAAALDASEHTRRERQEPSMTEPERLAFLDRWSLEYVEGTQGIPGEIKKEGQVEKPNQKVDEEKLPVRKIRGPKKLDQGEDNQGAQK